MSPTTARSLMIVTGIVALAVVVALAVLYRESGFQVTVDADRQITLDFQSNEVPLAEILDRALRPDQGTEGEKELAEALLERRGYYHISDPRLIDGLRRIDHQENQRIVAAMRRLLYDLAGPFSRPDTFAGAQDDRLLEAFNDLEESSPLLSSLWRMSLDLEGIFRPRPIKASVQRSEGVKAGYASACAGSVLAGKQLTLFAGGRALGLFVQANLPCPARSARQLLAGEPARLQIARSDFGDLAAEGHAREAAMEASFIIAPKNFTTARTGA